jgi:hypothetical protein
MGINDRLNEGNCNKKSEKKLMAISGIYESLITELLQEKLKQYKNDDYYIGKQKLDSAESANYLSQFLSHILHTALESLPNSDDRITKQIDLSNDLIKWLVNYLKDTDLSENIIDSQGQILSALFSKQDPVSANLKSYISKITPLSGLSQSELFTGSNTGLSLDSEIKREILSSDEICWLVSFIKWTGMRIFTDVLKRCYPKRKTNKDNYHFLYGSYRSESSRFSGQLAQYRSSY